MKKTIIVLLLFSIALLEVQAQKFIGESKYLAIEDKDAFAKAFAELSTTLPGLGKLVVVDPHKQLLSEMKKADLRMAVVVFDLKSKWDSKKFKNAWPSNNSIGVAGEWFLGNNGNWFIGQDGDWWLPLAAGLSHSISASGQSLKFPDYMNLGKAIPQHKPKLSTVVFFDTGGKPISNDHLQKYAPKDGSRYALLFTLVDKQILGDVGEESFPGTIFLEQHRPSMLVFF